MKHFSLALFFVAALALAPAALAQKWEIGVGAGGSFYTSQTVKSAIANADASLASGLAVSAWLGNNSGRLLGGEFRYDYESADLKLSSGGNTIKFGAQTHAVHYDFLLHFTPRESKVRPFVAAGAGIKAFRGTGTEAAFQPLSNIAILTKTNQTKPLVSLGGGVKVALGPAIQIRLEAHDYLTPFPKNLIAPASGAKVGGWLQDFVIMAGLGFTF
ncbi:MAG: outer membrane beta-barrel protein [Acidobacteriota bacterium]|jgi:hypothetical protein|nr:outer membrane beta-barrel protein [Acidobacteriota bacterium]